MYCIMHIRLYYIRIRAPRQYGLQAEGPSTSEPMRCLSAPFIMFPNDPAFSLFRGDNINSYCR